MFHQHSVRNDIELRYIGVIQASEAFIFPSGFKILHYDEQVLLKHKRFDAKQAFKQRDGMTALHMAAKGGLSVNHGVHDSVNGIWLLATTTKNRACDDHTLFEGQFEFHCFFDVLIGNMMNRIMIIKKMRIRSSVIYIIYV